MRQNSKFCEACKIHTMEQNAFIEIAQRQDIKIANTNTVIDAMNLARFFGCVEKNKPDFAMQILTLWNIFVEQNGANLQFKSSNQKV